MTIQAVKLLYADWKPPSPSGKPPSERGMPLLLHLFEGLGGIGTGFERMPQASNPSSFCSFPGRYA